MSQLDSQHTASLQPFDSVRAKCGAPVVTKHGTPALLAFFPTLIAVYNKPICDPTAEEMTDPWYVEDIGDVECVNLKGERREGNKWLPYLFMVGDTPAMTLADIQGALKDAHLMRTLMNLFLADGTDWETARVVVARTKRWTMGAATDFLTQCEQVTGLKLER